MALVQNVDNQSDQQWAHNVDLPVGEILRRARCHYGLSVPEVEKAIRIRASQLMALENSDFSKLPGRVYAIGFVRTYSEFLGLDGGQMVHLYKVQFQDGGTSPALHFPVPASESKTPNMYVLASCFAALVMVMIAGSWFYTSDRASGNIEIAEAPQASSEGSDLLLGAVSTDNSLMPLQAALVAAIEPAAGTGTGSSNFAAVMPERSMKIHVSDTSWIEIKDKSGKALLSKVLKAGDVYTLPDLENMTLSTGNAGGLEIYAGDNFLSKLGEKGDVLRNIKLDRGALIEYVSQIEKTQISPEQVH